MSSNYFHQNSRWLCDSINAPSPYRTWNNHKFRMTLLNALWTLKVKKVDSTVLRSAIGLRKYIASQFRPSAYKAIIDMFDAKDILDFSSGWGDRLSGFMASNAESYTMVDPNKRLVEGYEKQIETFLGGDKKVTRITGMAEETTYKDKFDLVATSPPYFNIERYTQEDDQSFKKFRKLDSWLEGFLYKSIENGYNSLKDGGVMAINISDVYSNHTVNKICDPMNEFIGSLPNMVYDGCYGYEMRKRPNSGALRGRSGVFCEPLWVWRKTCTT